MNGCEAEKKEAAGGTAHRAAGGLYTAETGFRDLYSPKHFNRSNVEESGLLDASSSLLQEVMTLWVLSRVHLSVRMLWHTSEAR